VIASERKSTTLFGEMSMTSESPFPYGQGPLIPSAAPPPRRSSIAIAAIITLVGSAALGLVGGLVWNALAPSVPYVIVSPGSADVTNAETSTFITGDVWYCAIAVIGGLIIGTISYLYAIRKYGPVPMAAVLAGSFGAGYLARWVGQNLGLAKFNAELATSKVGTVLHAPPVLGSDPGTVVWSAIVLWTLAASLVAGIFLTLAALGDRNSPGGRVR
jgi:hypothetical protein